MAEDQGLYIELAYKGVEKFMAQTAAVEQRLKSAGKNISSANEAVVNSQKKILQSNQNMIQSYITVSRAARRIMMMAMVPMAGVAATAFRAMTKESSVAAINMTAQFSKINKSIKSSLSDAFIYAANNVKIFGSTGIQWFEKLSSKLNKLTSSDIQAFANTLKSLAYITTVLKLSEAFAMLARYIIRAKRELIKFGEARGVSNAIANAPNVVGPVANAASTAAGSGVGSAIGSGMAANLAARAVANTATKLSRTETIKLMDVLNSPLSIGGKKDASTFSEYSKSAHRNRKVTPMTMAALGSRYAFGAKDITSYMGRGPSGGVFGDMGDRFSRMGYSASVRTRAFGEYASEKYGQFSGRGFQHTSPFAGGANPFKGSMASMGAFGALAVGLTKFTLIAGVVTIIASVIAKLLGFKDLMAAIPNVLEMASIAAKDLMTVFGDMTTKMAGWVKGLSEGLGPNKEKGKTAVDKTIAYEKEKSDYIKNATSGILPFTKALLHPFKAVDYAFDISDRSRSMSDNPLKYATAAVNSKAIVGVSPIMGLMNFLGIGQKATSYASSLNKTATANVALRNQPDIMVKNPSTVIQTLEENRRFEDDVVKEQSDAYQKNRDFINKIKEAQSNTWMGTTGQTIGGAEQGARYIQSSLSGWKKAFEDNQKEILKLQQEQTDSQTERDIKIYDLTVEHQKTIEGLVRDPMVTLKDAVEMIKKLTGKELMTLKLLNGNLTPEETQNLLQ